MAASTEAWRLPPAGTVTVQPFADWEQIEYVRLVDYELGGLLLPMAGQEQPKGPR